MVIERLFKGMDFYAKSRFLKEQDLLIWEDKPGAIECLPSDTGRRCPISGFPDTDNSSDLSFQDANTEEAAEEKEFFTPSPQRDKRSTKKQSRGTFRGIMREKSMRGTDEWELFLTKLIKQDWSFLRNQRLSVRLRA